MMFDFLQSLTGGGHSGRSNGQAADSLDQDSPSEWNRAFELFLNQAGPLTGASPEPAQAQSKSGSAAIELPALTMDSGTGLPQAMDVPQSPPFDWPPFTQAAPAETARIQPMVPVLGERVLDTIRLSGERLAVDNGISLPGEQDSTHAGLNELFPVLNSEAGQASGLDEKAPTVGGLGTAVWPIDPESLGLFDGSGSEPALNGLPMDGKVQPTATESELTAATGPSDSVRQNSGAEGLMSLPGNLTEFLEPQALSRQATVLPSVTNVTNPAAPSQPATPVGNLSPERLDSAAEALLKEPLIKRDVLSPTGILPEGAKPAAEGVNALLAAREAQRSAPRTDAPSGVAAPITQGLDARPLPLASDLTSVPGAPRQAAQQSFERVVVLARQDGGVARIQLRPPELGQVDIRVSVQGKEASVQIMAANGQVRDALEQMLPRLREMLEQQGLSLGDASVSDSDSQQQEWAEKTRESGSGRSGDGASGESADDEPTERARVSTGLLDTYA